VATAVLCALAVLALAACGGETNTQAVTGGGIDRAVFADHTDAPGYLAPISPDTEYVRALCEVDLAAVLTAENPLDEILAGLISVPTEDDLQRGELRRIIEGVSAATAVGLSPLESFTLLEPVGALLEARCSQ
jgi:hypothetical protein